MWDTYSHVVWDPWRRAGFLDDDEYYYVTAWYVDVKMGMRRRGSSSSSRRSRARRSRVTPMTI
jgi:hypothetical protein